MAERDRLEGLRPMAEEAFGGLTADEVLRRRVLRAAKEPEAGRVRTPAFRFVPAVCAALLLAVGLIAFREHKPAGQSFTEAQEPEIPAGGAVVLRAADAPADKGTDLAFSAAGEELEEAEETSGEALFAEAAPAFADADSAPALEIAEIEEIAAGAVPEAQTMMKSASLSGAEVRNSVSRGNTLFADGKPEIPVLCVNGAVYRLLKEPGTLSSGLTGAEIGTVGTAAEHPSLASKQELAGGVSNCCGAGSPVYAVSSLPKGTAVAAGVNGRMRLFQRVSYAGLGSAAPLSESLALSGKLREMTLSGVGTLSGEDAERVFSVLLSSANRIAREAEPGPGTLTFVLKNGLRLQMTVSGETLIACGAWQCPAFFEAFREAL